MVHIHHLSLMLPKNVNPKLCFICLLQLILLLDFNIVNALCCFEFTLHKALKITLHQILSTSDARTTLDALSPLSIASMCYLSLLTYGVHFLSAWHGYTSFENVGSLDALQYPSLSNQQSLYVIYPLYPIFYLIKVNFCHLMLSITSKSTRVHLVTDLWVIEHQSNWFDCIVMSSTSYICTLSTNFKLNAHLSAIGNRSK